MLLSWLEEDVASERDSHSSLAHAVAIAACIAAALLVHHHLPAVRSMLYSAVKTPHAVAVHHPLHMHHV